MTRREVTENKHSTDMDSNPPPPRICMTIHHEGKPCSDLSWPTLTLLVLLHAYV